MWNGPPVSAAASIFIASPSITRNWPGKASLNSASAGMQRRSRSTAVTFAPARNSARVRPPGPGPTSNTGCPTSEPGTAAMRFNNCSSNRKFWPSALFAESPWRAITSRKGGRSGCAVMCSFANRRAGFLRRMLPYGSRQSSNPGAQYFFRQWRRRCHGRAMSAQSADPKSD